MGKKVDASEFTFIPNLESDSYTKAFDTRQMQFVPTTKLDDFNSSDENDDQMLSIAFYLPDVQRQFVIKQDLFILGRSDPKNDIFPDIDLSIYHEGAHKLGVSREHACISFEDGNVYITDLYSTNGTYVNHHKLEPQHKFRICSGNFIQLGFLNLRLG